MAAATAFLSVRPRSVTEVRRRLAQLGYPVALSDTVVERLVDLGYLDDRAFANAWIESRDRARPRGALALRRELALKGLARELIDEVLEERGTAAGAAPTEPELAAAARLLARREAALRREAEPRRRRQRAYALLARHGFTPDICRQATSAFLGADPELAGGDG
jgi:regulatory protein